MSRRRKKLKAEHAARAAGDDLDQLFPVYPCPGSSAVVPFVGDDERVAAARFLAGKSWPSLTMEYVVANYRHDLSALPCWLTPSGFVYYLPAFIRLCRDHPNGVNCLAEAVLGAFRRTDGDWQSVLATLDKPQRECIWQFLKAHFGRRVDYGDREAETFGFWKEYMGIAARVLRVAPVEEQPTGRV